MAKLIDTEFTAYEFGEEEEGLAYIYTDIQIQGLRTELSKVAQMKLDLVPDILGTRVFQMEHRYLQGKMDVLRSLILLSEDSKKRIEESIRAEMANRPQFTRS